MITGRHIDVADSLLISTLVLRVVHNSSQIIETENKSNLKTYSVELLDNPTPPSDQ